MRKSTFIKYQDLYFKFMTYRAKTGCSQKAFCRQFGVLPMTLSRAVALAQEKKVDYSMPFPDDPAIGLLPSQHISTRDHAKIPVVEFMEVLL